MSRSRKKTPIRTVGKCHANAMKAWKRQCNQKLRNLPIDQEIPQGSHYKPMSGDPWIGPSDGKCYAPEEEKISRK